MCRRPIAWSATLSALLHPVFNYILIVPLKLGYLGSAWSNTVTQAVWLAVLLAYIYGSGLAREVGLRWSFAEGCQQLKGYMKVRAESSHAHLASAAPLCWIVYCPCSTFLCREPPSDACAFLTLPCVPALSFPNFSWPSRAC